MLDGSPGANGVPDWTGEVVGPPTLYPLKTVNVIAAGKTIAGIAPTLSAKVAKRLGSEKITEQMVQGQADKR